MLVIPRASGMIIKFCVGGGSRSVHDQQVHTRREEQRCSSCNPNPYTSLEVVNTLTVISKKGIHHQERRKGLPFLTVMAVVGPV